MTKSEKWLLTAGALVFLMGVGYYATTIFYPQPTASTDQENKLTQKQTETEVNQVATEVDNPLTTSPDKLRETPSSNLADHAFPIENEKSDDQSIEEDVIVVAGKTNWTREKIEAIMEERALAAMHEHGWYKPEDVPIVRSKPVGSPIGLYIWREDENGGYRNHKMLPIPEDIKLQAQSIQKELDEVSTKEDNITDEDVERHDSLLRELKELYIPYGGKTRVKTHAKGIPGSWWRSYFRPIVEAEEDALIQEITIWYNTAY